MLNTPLQMILVALAGWVNEHQLAVIEYLKQENRVLREQVGRRRLRFTDDQRRRLAAKGKAIGRRVLRELGAIVTPDKILRWYRRLVARNYDGLGKRRPGHPRVMDAIRTLAARMALENERWAYTRIVGELAKLGPAVSRSTVRRILKARGIDPAPERSKRMPWSTFLKAHWEAMAAADIFTVEALSCVGLIRYVVFFVIDLPTRKVEIAGIAPIPDGLWMEQVARNLIDDFSGFLREKRFLIHDRDPPFTRGFRELLQSAGVTSVRLPPRRPNLNALAERFVLSIKSECLNRLVILGERHLRRAIPEYLEHYHHERTHQGLGNRLIEGVPELASGRVVRRERLGGLLKHYYREAA
ncbi:MAG: integrase core domain-containing protein [Planctomycetota bacterium]|jgi:transposase InsO family protein